MSEIRDDMEKDFVHLIQVYNDVEAAIVEGLLKEYNIPSIKKYKGNKGFMKVLMGTALGVDIYVKAQDFKLAKEIVENADLSEIQSDFPYEDKD